MIDPSFHKLLQLLEKNYRHREVEVQAALGAMRLNFTEIGRLAQSDDPHGCHTSVRLLLIAIAADALNLLNHHDYQRLFAEILSLHDRKNSGYAGLHATDPWANFRMAQWFGVSAFTGCMIRMTDKFIRITHLVEDPDADKVGESIRDTLQDLAVYCMIAICLWEEEQTVVLCEAGQPA